MNRFAAAFALLLASVSAFASDLTRDRLIQALLAEHVFQPERQILRVTHLCDIKIGSASDPVADLIEQTPGAEVPRGDRRVVLLSPALKVIKEISYYPPAVPLFCSGDTLYFSSEIRIDNADPAGNAVTFKLDGSYAVTSQVDPNKLPAPTSAGIARRGRVRRTSLAARGLRRAVRRRA